MNKADTLKKIKENLKSLMKFSNELKEEGFGNFDLTDGTKITSPSADLEIGSEVYAIDDQGNQTPLDDGEYVLTDGRTITLKGNKIENISSGDDEMPEDDGDGDGDGDGEQEMSDTGMPDDQQAEAGDKAHNDIAARLSDLEKQIENILNILNKLGQSQGEVNEQMMNKINFLSNENGDKPIKTRKRASNTYDPKNAGLQEFREHLKIYQDLINKK